jgi:thiol-disulfide isomerase/thioredoxin
MCKTRTASPSPRTASGRALRALSIVVGATAAGALACALGGCGSQVTTYAPPKTPVTQISNTDYQSLLDKYVGENGKVDYGRWKDNAADVQSLDAYLSTLTNATPETRPDLFKTQTDKLSYWINLYNAVVLREIIRRWPLDSVTDVRVNATSFVKTGKGFFYDLEFVIGGEKMNLYDIENKIIRAQFKDARIHFAINCGSSSCPLLRKDAFDATKLEGQLESASTQFVNDGKNVTVDDAKKQVVMSKIFEWYSDDFIAFTKQRAKTKDAGVVDFALLYAKDPLSAKLKDAKAKSYKVVFLDYDWNVNKQDGSAAPPGATAAAGLTAPHTSPTEGVGQAIPDVEFKLADGSGTWKPSSAKGKVVLVDFWATFCKPCKGSFPRLQALHEKYKDSGLVVIGISEDDEPKTVVPAFLKETGAKFLIGIDPEQSAASPPFKVSAMPTELVIDRKGIVRHRHEGLRDGEIDEIVKQIEELLKEK